MPSGESGREASVARGRGRDELGEVVLLTGTVLLVPIVIANCRPAAS